jgi:membrane associated rhomboid family serine protease|tara:strand:- start:361 stop:519 length:159 start_codon:yes stop_codon:yes gene_type:complete
MLILIWFIVCILFAFVQMLLGDSGHSLEVFAILTAIALFIVHKLKGKIKFTK